MLHELRFGKVLVYFVGLLAPAWCQVPAFTISTIAGNGIQGYLGDGGPATSAEINNPRGIASDPAGNIYFCDYTNNRVRKISTLGVVTTVAGTGVGGYNADNVPGVVAQLKMPYRVSLDAAGNVYIADAGNNRIRKLAPTGFITTVAGSGAANYTGDNGPATSATLNFPEDIVVDASGSIFIVDTANNAVRKVNTSGIITTVAGNGLRLYAGDSGPAIQASLNQPVSIAVDSTGNLFISDQGNNVIRKVDTKGVITTVAGNGINDFAGDGGPAKNASFRSPAGVAVDSEGNLYIVDVNSNRIRVLLTNGNITTVAGNGTAGPLGDGGPAISAQLNHPRSVGVGTFGNIYISDFLNNEIRQLAPSVPTLGFIANAFGNTQILGPNTWVILKGTSLAPAGDSRIWRGPDFLNGQLPTSLDGVRVTMNGVNAYVYYISPTQINVLTPPDLAPGQVQVQVNNNGAKSAAANIQAQPYSLSFFQFGSGPYVAAVHGDATYLGPTTLYAGLTTPALPGETVIIFANGFGATSSAVLSGSPSQSGNLPTLPVVTIGGTQAPVLFAGLISPGLYQFNIVVPTSLPSGDNVLTAMYNGLTTQPGVLISIQ